MEKRKERGGITGPVILITIGVVLLLNNLDVIDWSVWTAIFRLWPILIVSAGLDLLIGQRSFWGALLALVIVVGLVAGSIWMLEGGLGAGTFHGEEIEQPLEDVAQAQVTVDPGVGRLHVEALLDSTNLVEGTIGVDQQEDLERSFSVEGDAGTFTLRTGQDSFSWPFGAWGNERLWALRLNADVPLRLEANVGMGEVDLDLTGCTLDDLRVDAGIGRVEALLPAEGDFRADLGGAIGEMVVVVPADLEVRIEVDTGITGRQIDDAFRRDGDVYTSAGYAGADRRVDLRVSQAIGNLVIRRGR